ncbi:MAG: 16S rRNA (guanine(966)-N(2))-methyltransferase RsmD [Gammaproteobacteria bacterium]|nr:MAG: 16S rRNA (guanine(966)-N(2))-methyltransferase RsmD [Gammaproteobacteria bacterium]
MKHHQRSTSSPTGRGASGQLRIIGGQWRGRKLRFNEVAGLRPTGDRIRETLFNWLAPVMAGAHCLDLFAGSGALGLEALSRGAASSTMVEIHPKAASILKDNCQLLRAEGAEVVVAEALGWLEATHPAQPFDVVFLDPPFSANLLQPCLNLLSRPGLLAPDAYIYTEADRNQPPPVTPADFSLAKEKNAGQVCYRLYRLFEKGA